MFFLGKDFLLVARLGYEDDRLTKLTPASFIDDAAPDILKFWTTDGDKKEPVEVRWRLVDRQFLELNEKGTWLRYVPATIENLEELGVPRVYFETWVDTFQKQGSFAITRALVPDFS